MRRLFFRDSASGDNIEDVYVITNKQLAATSNNKLFIKALVSDRTAQLTARMWNATRDIFNALPESGFVRLRGRIESYQNNLQLIIEQLWPAQEGAFDIADLVPQTDKDIGQMFAKVSQLLSGIRNRHLSALMAAFLADEELMTRFRKAPAAMTFHHAFLGGLLEHTLNSMEVAQAICPFYPGLSRDLVISGIFLHDIAKTWELSYDCSFGYTDAGQLVGHVVKAAFWVEDKARAAEAALGEKLPRALIDVLEHIILSHHGLPEHGAARVPSTPEAIAVHTIENLDAKMMMSLGATRGQSIAPGAEGNWTEYMKAFAGRLYRPDVAPVDIVADGPAEQPPTPATPPDKPSQGPAPKIAITNPLFEPSPAKKK